MDFLTATHRHLVEGLLLVMFFNLALPYLLRENAPRRIFSTRIGYFAFWMLWTMVLFSGLIVFVFLKQPMTTPVIAMLVLSVALPVLDAYRAIRLKKIWLQEETGIGFSSKILLGEILLVTGVMQLAIFH